MSDEIEGFNSPIEWPEAGEALFRSMPQTSHNATIYRRGDDWYQYISSYKRSADILVETAIESGNGHDFMVLPAVFLYRQYLELQLKQLLRDCKVLADDDPTISNRHDLVPLWDVLKKAMRIVFPVANLDNSTSGAAADLSVVETWIRQFDAIDPKSMAFRYPIGTKGEILLPEDARVFDLDNLKNVMAKLENFLNGIATGISVELESKQEMERYFMPDGDEYFLG